MILASTLMLGAGPEDDDGRSLATLSVDLDRKCRPSVSSDFFLVGEVGSLMAPLAMERLLTRECFVLGFSWSDTTAVPSMDVSLSWLRGLSRLFAWVSAQSCLMNSILMVLFKFRILYLWFSGMLRLSSIASR